MAEYTRDFKSGFRWIQVACYLLGLCIGFLSPLFLSDERRGIAVGVLIYNGAILAVIFRLAEGRWPTGRSRTLELYGHLTWTILWSWWLPNIFGWFLASPYSEMAAGAVFVIIFFLHFAFNDTPAATPAPPQANA